jgi:hypothetical protein
MHKVEVDDKRALPDVEVYKKTRALLERLAAAGHPVDKRLLERSPFDAVLEGQVVENAVKDVARPVFPAPQSAENGDPGTSSEPKSDEFGDKNASNDEPGHQET